MTKTPVCDFIKKYRKISKRFHMPGHKGAGKVEKDDITEIVGADVLYSPSGIILQSEKIASKIFESSATFFSVEGSSLLIRAVVYLLSTRRIGMQSVKIAAARNVHSSFISACALSGVDPVWLYGDEDNMMSTNLNLVALDAFLKAEKPLALYITSPDYLGYRSVISQISDICHKYGTLLVVDNAHGAYLKFVDNKSHPLDAGADICIESAHKTLPCLTGTAYLHFGKNCPDYFLDNANDALRLFASTSPSYLLIESLDKFNGLAEKYAEKVKKTVCYVSEVKEALKKVGFDLCGDEPLKITLMPKNYGYLGTEVAEFLEKHGVYAEFFDKDYVTFMISPLNKKSSIDKLCALLKTLPKKDGITTSPPRRVVGERALSIRDAVFSLKEEIPVTEACGRVLAELSVSCPPAVPVLCVGEVITKEAVEAFTYYDINNVKVVKR